MAVLSFRKEGDESTWTSAELTEGGGAPNASLPQLPAPETIATSDLAVKLTGADAAIANVQQLLAEVRSSHDRLCRTLDDLKRDRDEWRGQAERLAKRPWWRRLAGGVTRGSPLRQAPA